MQSACRLLRSSEPPWFLGTMWSTSRARWCGVCQATACSAALAAASGAGEHPGFDQGAGGTAAAARRARRRSTPPLPVSTLPTIRPPGSAGPRPPRGAGLRRPRSSMSIRGWRPWSDAGGCGATGPGLALGGPSGHCPCLDPVWLCRPSPSPSGEGWPRTPCRPSRWLP